MRKQRIIIEACHMPCTVVGCQLLCSGLCLARGVLLQLFVQTYHRLLSAFGTSIINAYSTHFVKSSGLNAKAKFHYRSLSYALYRNQCSLEGAHPDLTAFFSELNRGVLEDSPCCFLPNTWSMEGCSVQHNLPCSRLWA